MYTFDFFLLISLPPALYILRFLQKFLHCNILLQPYCYRRLGSFWGWRVFCVFAKQEALKMLKWKMKTVLSLFSISAARRQLTFFECFQRETIHQTEKLLEFCLPTTIHLFLTSLVYIFYFSLFAAQHFVLNYLANSWSVEELRLLLNNLNNYLKVPVVNSSVHKNSFTLSPQR